MAYRDHSLAERADHDGARPAPSDFELAGPPSDESVLEAAPAESERVFQSEKTGEMRGAVRENGEKREDWHD